MQLQPDRLKAIRLRRLMTQRELARAAGLSEAAINRLEQGLNPARVSTVRKIAEALKVSAREFVVWDEKDDAEKN